MTKWLLLGAVGVAFLIAGAWLIASGVSSTTGQVLGATGVVLVLVCVAVFALVPRSLLLPPKHRRIIFGVGIAGRVLKILGVLVAAIVVFVVFMST